MPTSTLPPSTQFILITGATGKQGHATLLALLTHPLFLSSPLHILALTRTPSSPKAQSLLTLSPRIHLHAGDLSNSPAIFTTLPPSSTILAIFSVQVDTYGSASSIALGEIHGRALIDAAASHAVRVFVQASSDRGGAANSATDPTPVPQFITKFVVEKHLQDVVARSKTSDHPMSYTVLRPASFMENCGEDGHGKGFVALWACMGAKKLQLVSTVDVGRVAARALMEAESVEWRDRAVGLAGDELTFREASEIFERVRGRRMPKAFAMVGVLVKWYVPELRAMFEWFENVGFGVDIEECRRVEPGMLDFEGWLMQTDNYKR